MTPDQVETWLLRASPYVLGAVPREGRTIMGQTAIPKGYFPAFTPSFYTSKEQQTQLYQA